MCFNLSTNIPFRFENCSFLSLQNTVDCIYQCVGFCRGSRVEGSMSRVEGRGRGSRSRVEVEGKKNIFSCGLYLLGQSVCFAK